MPTWAGAMVGPLGECSLCRGERPVGPAADDRLRLGPQPGNGFFDGAQLDVFAESVPIGHEILGEPDQETWGFVLVASPPSGVARSG